jgi:hypothetical protein
MDALLTTHDVAALLQMSEEWVREHATELGGIRMGDSPRAPLRFDMAGVEAWKLLHRLAEPAPPPARHRPGPRRAPAGVELLPLPSRSRTRGGV